MLFPVNRIIQSTLHTHIQSLHPIIQETQTHRHTEKQKHTEKEERKRREEREEERRRGRPKGEYPRGSVRADERIVLISY